MKLFIAKEKFAAIKGFDSYDDYFQKIARRLVSKNLTIAKVEESYELIKKHSRYFIFHVLIWFLRLKFKGIIRG